MDMMEQLIDIINTIENEELKKCLIEVFEDKKELLLTLTCGCNHHQEKGGLLKHLIGVTKLSLLIYDNYKGYKIDRDLLIANACLHDIGKILTSNTFEQEIYMTHSHTGIAIALPYLNRYKLSEGYKNQILHSIAVHAIDESKNVGPLAIRTIEAYIVHQADGLDAFLDPLGKEPIINYKEGEAFKSNFPRELITSYKE